MIDHAKKLRRTFFVCVLSMDHRPWTMDFKIHQRDMIDQAKKLRQNIFHLRNSPWTMDF